MVMVIYISKIDVVYKQNVKFVEKMLILDNFIGFLGLRYYVCIILRSKVYSAQYFCGAMYALLYAFMEQSQHYRVAKTFSTLGVLGEHLEFWKLVFD